MLRLTTDINDRPRGDFIISYHPAHKGLFLATGGSGHGYKFLPVLGDKIIDALEGRLESELQALWDWNATTPGAHDIFDGDGSRSGERNSNLKEELAKTRKAGTGSAL